MVKAQKLLERAAEQDLNAAQYALGKLYLSDDADVHDSAKGIYWLKRSADNGNDYAAYRLGKEYLSGKNVSKDTSTAAEQGHQEGRGIFQDREPRCRRARIFSVTRPNMGRPHRRS